MNHVESAEKNCSRCNSSIRRVRLNSRRKRRRRSFSRDPIQRPHRRLLINIGVSSEKILIVIASAVSFGLPLLAHTGRHEKVMGTVVAIRDATLEVKTTDGRTAATVLNDKTKVFKGAQAVKRTTIHDGDWVVVTTMAMKGSDGKAMLVAEEIRLGTSPPTKTNGKNSLD